jgi:hypothetical protein
MIPGWLAGLVAGSLVGWLTSWTLAMALCGDIPCIMSACFGTFCVYSGHQPSMFRPSFGHIPPMIRAPGLAIICAYAGCIWAYAAHRLDMLRPSVGHVPGTPASILATLASILASLLASILARRYLRYHLQVVEHASMSAFSPTPPRQQVTILMLPALHPRRRRAAYYDAATDATPRHQCGATHAVSASSSSNPTASKCLRTRIAVHAVDNIYKLHLIFDSKNRIPANMRSA